MTKQAKFFFVPPEDTIADEFMGIPQLEIVHPDAQSSEWGQATDSPHHPLVAHITDRQVVFGF